MSYYCLKIGRSLPRDGRLVFLSDEFGRRRVVFAAKVGQPFMWSHGAKPFEQEIRVQCESDHSPPVFLIRLIFSPFEGKPREIEFVLDPRTDGMEDVLKQLTLAEHFDVHLWSNDEFMLVVLRELPRLDLLIEAFRSMIYVILQPSGIASTDKTQPAESIL